MFHATFEHSTNRRDFHLGIMFFIHTAADKPIEHVHQDFYELVIVKEGSALHVWEGIPMPVGEGGIFLIAPGERHYYADPRNFGIYNLVFGADLLDYFYHDLSGLSGFQILFDGIADPCGRRRKNSGFGIAPEFLPAILRQLAELAAVFQARETGYRTAMLATFLKLLCQLARHCRPANPGEILPAARISRAVGFLKKNYSRPCALPQLAALAGMPEEAFRENFRRTTGATPQQYRTELRLQAAREQLALPQLSITEIAVKTGFSDGNYLTRLFKKRFGLTPSEYRSQSVASIHPFNPSGSRG